MILLDLYTLQTQTFVDSTRLNQKLIHTMKNGSITSKPEKKHKCVIISKERESLNLTGKSKKESAQNVMRKLPQKQTSEYRNMRTEKSL